MEELRRTAHAYYNNSSQEFKDMAINFFQVMDADGSGRVSFEEFGQFLRWNGYEWVDHRSWFPHLDANGDGYLDFWEVLTFYYVLKTRGVWCKCCSTQLHALYFTCVECFDAGQPFDLCSVCYGDRKYSHHHRGLFLDSYVLLRSKLGCPGENFNNAITQPYNGTNSQSAEAITQPNSGTNPQYCENYWLTALDVAFAAANLSFTLGGCAVM